MKLYLCLRSGSTDLVLFVHETLLLRKANSKYVSDRNMKFACHCTYKRATKIGQQLSQALFSGEVTGFVCWRLSVRFRLRLSTPLPAHISSSHVFNSSLSVLYLGGISVPFGSSCVFVSTVGS